MCKPEDNKGHEPSSSSSGNQAKKKSLKRMSTKKELKAEKQHEVALETIRNLFKSTGHTLVLWLRYFDKNCDLQISFQEFCYGIGKLKYTGNVTLLFEHMDSDASGTIELIEIDEEASKIWMKFRMWCVGQFENANDMLLKLGNGVAECLTQKAFIEGCQRLGWTAGNESLLFDSIDADSNGVTDGLISASALKWFDYDKKKHNRKQKAKKKAVKEQLHFAKERREIDSSLQNFKAFLKQKYSTFLRAWRNALDLDGSMTIQKHELFQAVKEMCWKGDARTLWKGLDKDNSGITSLQELDLQTAVKLARFKEFICFKFGSSAKAFQAFDTMNKRKLKVDEFTEACKSHGFQGMSKALFHGLDCQGNKSLMAEDLAFLDSWRCPAHLTCEVNEEAAADLKALLKQKHRNYLKAWRVCLDRDNSNHVGWDEFDGACRQLNFDGDRPGAWRWLDSDLSGFITLAELDPESSDVLSFFKHWADEEFGSVRSAFNVLDSDNSGAMSMKEFRRACTSYGYQGNSAQLFGSLDVDGTGSLSLDEVGFIDSWSGSGSRQAVVDSVASWFASADSNSNPFSGLFGGGGKKETKKNAAKPASASDRINELAKPRPKVGPTPPAAGVAPNSMPLGESSWFLKPKTTRSPYLPSTVQRLEPVLSWQGQTMPPLVGAYTTLSKSNQRWAMGLKRPEVRDQILQQPPIQERSMLEDEAGLDPSVVSLRSKTKALRNRTVDLICKVDASDQQTIDQLLTSPQNALFFGLMPDSALR